MPDDLMTKLEEIQGAGFVSGTHDLKSIHDDLATGIANIMAAVLAIVVDFTPVLVAITAAQAAILAAIAVLSGTVDYIKRILDHIKTMLQRHDFAFLKRIGRNK